MLANHVERQCGCNGAYDRPSFPLLFNGFRAGCQWRLFEEVFDAVLGGGGGYLVGAALLRDNRLGVESLPSSCAPGHLILASSVGR
jgi:hypothetical protein